MMKRNIFLFSFLFVLLLLIGACTEKSVGGSSGTKVTVFKSPSCGCCVGHAAELDKGGFDVEIVKVEDMQAIKKQYNVPSNMESCHTAVIGDYFVEGHVPMEAIDKLLLEQPDIDGIALPNMPAGSPGMPGVKRSPFRVYAISNGEVSDFVTI